ncbi:MAG: HAMP domain-containing protein [Elusimicrobia bacterium]|nr:HAMP domain-containing protein [Elusimicrobiota bacterium]
MKKLNKIAVKLCLFSSVLILLVIAVMAHLILKEARTSLIYELQARTDSFARAAREAFSPKLDIFTLHLRVNELAKEKAIKYLLVSDPAGKILSHSMPEKIGETDTSAEGMHARNSRALETQVSVSAGGENYYISAPVMLGTARLATAAVALTRESLDYALQKTRNKILLLSLAALLAAVLGTIVIVNWFIRPIPLLAKAAREIGLGKLDVEIKWNGSDEMGLLTRAFNDMAKGLRERDHIRKVFGRYVSKEIADTVLKGGLALGGEKREITAFFADIRDFSKLSRQMSPEEMVALLNNYFTRMTQIIHTFGGTTDKFIGDGIFAMFGAPLALQNGPERALQAALRMRDSMELFNAERALKNSPPIRIGICVASGSAVVGSIGSESRADYTAIGEPVNLAARMEGLNKKLGTNILVSAPVYAALKDKFEFRALGAHNVRGWEDPVEVFELIDELKKKQAPG